MAKKNFETALSRLEEITRELEDGDIELDTSLKKFDEGMKLIQFCNAKLDESQKKIDILLHKNGKLESIPFDPETDINQET
ncbi:MAG: exodeoxyribonuclease VII small subunit [Desulfobulbaceae bacterium]|nr:exodeoxyribonuclease VII small subunit [Desulfobulbaceae bacterium]